jgi:NADH-quinone oxidoreductase subunit N
MNIIPFAPNQLIAIATEIGLVILALVILIFDLVWKGDQRRRIAWVTAGGLLLIGLVNAFIMPITEAALLFGGMIRYDGLTWLMGMVFCFGGMITALLVKDQDKLGREGEFYLLMVTSILGMTLMASASDLILLFLAIETTSIPLYILAGFFKRNEASTEAGFKYLLYGAATSAVMLYGFSLLFGFTGTTQISDMAQVLQYFSQYSFPLVPNATLDWIPVGVMLLILVGLAFKISAVPMHFWAPDVYQGAPTPVAGFLSTASKAAGFVVILRILLNAFGSYHLQWSIVLSVLAAASMLFGNLQAMRQHNIKRLLAYSSIAQAGYILIGVASINIYGFAGMVFYLIAYMVTNLAAFGIVSIVEQQVKSEEIEDYAGLARRSPSLSLGLLVAFLSLAGIPPFAGFVGKIMLFSSGAMMISKYWWLTALVILGVFNSILALYYYLRVIKIVYQGESKLAEPVQVTHAMRIAVILCVVGILVVGILIAPAFNFAGIAATSLYN